MMRIATFSLLSMSLFSGNALGGVGEALNHHTLGLFLGGTSNDKTEFTIGGEYEYRFSEIIGAGPIIEYIPEAHNRDGALVTIGAVHVHAAENFLLTLGIGDEHIDTDHGSIDEILYRVGGAFVFHVDEYEISPSVNVDFVGEKELVVFGITLGHSF